MLSDLDSIESDYFHYRALEFKKRLLIYGPLWQARVQSMEPLDRNVRSKGQIEEEAMLSDLEALDKQIHTLTNGIHRQFKDYLKHEASLEFCCPDKQVGECFQQAFQPLRPKVEEGLQLFERAFEQERSYNQAVETTVGGRKGLYPEDTVESGVAHKQLFDRFERERRKPYFDQDAAWVDFFHNTRELLTRQFPGDNCCLTCGKGHWNHQVDEMFEDPA